MKEIIFVQKDQIKEINDYNQIALHYSDEIGNIDDNIIILMAQLKILQEFLIKKRMFLGMMPHPERMIDSSLSGEDGSIFFENLINSLKIMISK